MGLSNCNKHHRIKPKQRFDILFGKNNYELFNTPRPKDDPLNWTDSKPYKERLKSARKKTGSNCSMLVASGTINNIQITAVASDFDFMGASIGAAEGEAFLFAAQHALENKPTIIGSCNRRWNENARVIIFIVSNESIDTCNQ